MKGGWVGGVAHLASAVAHRSMLCPRRKGTEVSCWTCQPWEDEQITQSPFKWKPISPPPLLASSPYSLKRIPEHQNDLSVSSWINVTEKLFSNIWLHDYMHIIISEFSKHTHAFGRCFIKSVYALPVNRDFDIAISTLHSLSNMLACKCLGSLFLTWSATLCNLSSDKGHMVWPHAQRWQLPIWFPLGTRHNDWKKAYTSNV